jgi:hypothetical protein
MYYQYIYIYVYIYGFIHTIIHDEQRLKQNLIYYYLIDLWVDNSIIVAIVQMVYGFRLWTLDFGQMPCCRFVLRVEMRIFDYAANGYIMMV